MTEPAKDTRTAADVIRTELKGKVCPKCGADWIPAEQKFSCDWNTGIDGQSMLCIKRELEQKLADAEAERDLLATLLATTLRDWCDDLWLPNGVCMELYDDGDAVWMVNGTTYPTLLDAIRAGMGTVDDDPLTSTTSPRPQ